MNSVGQPTHRVKEKYTCNMPADPWFNRRWNEMMKCHIIRKGRVVHNKNTNKKKLCLVKLEKKSLLHFLWFSPKNVRNLLLFVSFIWLSSYLWEQTARRASHNLSRAHWVHSHHTLWLPHVSGRVQIKCLLI